MPSRKKTFMVRVDLNHLDQQPLPPIRATVVAIVEKVFSYQHVISLLLPKQALKSARVGVAFASDTTIAKLNQDFLGKKGATNVLSFPGTLRPLTPYSKYYDVGDIVIAPHYTALEAKKYQMDPTVRLAHLLIHGVLHLLGYDHVDDVAAQQQMETVENQLLQELKPETYKKLGSLLS